MKILEEYPPLPHRKRILKFSLLGLSLLISVLYGMHHLLWLHDMDWDIQNTIFITSFKAYDANHYLAQLKDVYDGNYLLSNAYIAEYKNTARPLWPVFPFYLIALIGKILHLDVQYIALLMDFTLPSVIFLLTYTFLRTLSGHKRVAVLGASILVLTPHVLRISALQQFGIALWQALTSYNITHIMPSLWHLHAYHDGFSRQVNPQLTFIFLLAALFFFIRHITTSSHRNLYLAIFFGVLTSYSYVYFSSYLYLFWGIFAIASTLLKRWHDVKSTVIALGTTLIFAAPFWFSAFEFSEKELTQTTIMTKTHTPILTSQVFFILLLCGSILVLLKKRLMRQFQGILVLSLLLSAIGILNHRVLTGLEIQSWHYQVHILPQMTILAVATIAAELLNTFPSRYWGKPITIISLIIVLGVGLILVSILGSPSFFLNHLSADATLSSRSQRIFHIGRILGGIVGSMCIGAAWLHSRYKRPAWHISPGTLLYLIAFIPFILSVGAVQYQLYYGFLKAKWGYMQQLAPALQWLDTHTEPESVVLTSLDYTTPHVVVPIYTRNNLYYAPLVSCFAVPDLEELWERVYNILYFMGVSTQKDFVRYMSSSALRNGSFEAYQHKLQKNLYAELTRYRVDYVFYGPRERASFNIEPEKVYPFLHTVYTDRIVTIYQIL